MSQPVTFFVPTPRAMSPWSVDIATGQVHHRKWPGDRKIGTPDQPMIRPDGQRRTAGVRPGFAKPAWLEEAHLTIRPATSSRQRWATSLPVRRSRQIPPLTSIIWSIMERNSRLTRPRTAHRVVADRSSPASVVNGPSTRPIAVPAVESMIPATPASYSACGATRGCRAGTCRH